MRIQPSGQYVQLDLTGDSGVSFPSDPADGQLFYRTDRRVIYEYDLASTSWLGIDRRFIPFTGSSILENTTNTGTSGLMPLWEDTYVEMFVMFALCGSTLDGSHYYTATFYESPPTAAATALAAISNNGDTAGTNYVHTASIGLVIAAASFPLLQVALTKTSTPGTHNFSYGLVVRSVG